MERGYVSAIALNGAGLIHDYEIALSGSTSEDVDAALGKGQFGMSEETGRGLNEIIAAGVAGGQGIGQAVTAHLDRVKPPFARGQPARLGRAARRARHRSRRARDGHHPHASGVVWGGHRRGQPSRLSLLDVIGGPARGRRLSQLRVGGAVARSLLEGRVARPESRHLARRPHDGQSRFREALSSGNERRPAPGCGDRQGVSITGHHEILLPLLAATLLSRQ